ncbi:serine hydrolase domain-containing protein [Flagellimonas pacifica]|uniref:CubicO group peptidase, beta-lactamase class C family n=1 Tax=Flagellimonas pacifica TaxID=1247520 RepID=A0A285MV53_9FLAO|nr:serine hydrolase [Allomuricauda parva]SNZ01072.1 CubicO group peptidase, beta-lactamase class C family [Allomuricauda parva]
MNNHFFKLILLLAFHIGNGQVDLTTELTKEQSDLIFEKVKGFPNKAQISIAIISNGKAKYYGAKRANDSILTIENHKSVFEIGSITKVFTATLLADFVIEGKIELDDNINDFIDFTIKDNVPISFKQLATHTSGLPRLPESLSSPSIDLTNPYKDYNEEKLKLDLSEKLVMSEKPGTKSEYSNLGVGLLGCVLGEIDNSTYGDLVQTKIFDRHQMSNSTTIRSKVMDKLVLGINENGQEVSNWDMSILMGAGGILSTTEDLTKFAIAHFDDNNKDLGLTRTPFHKATDNFSTGLAWGIITTESEAIWYWHNGGTGGYTSSMIIDTEEENGVIILSNISALGTMANNVMSLCPELMKTLE